MRLYSRATCIAAFSIFGQRIRKFHPIELATGPRVVFRRQTVGVVEATSRDVDFVREIFVLKSQLRAALRTETARALRRRSKPRRVANDDSELRPRHAEPRYERCAGGSTTDRTMAVRLMKRRARRLITNPSAKASALKHSIARLSVFLHGHRAA